MISITEMKELVEKDREIEKQAKEVKYEKDLAMYRDKLKEVKPELIKYIEKRIYNGLRYNSKIGLYTYHVVDMFKPIRDCGDNVLYYLADSTIEPDDAYEAALKELADIVRQELFDAGVKYIVNNPRNCFVGEPYLYLEV